MVPVPFADLAGRHSYLSTDLYLLGHRPVRILLKSFLQDDGLVRLLLHATPRIFLFLVEVHMLFSHS